MSRATLEFANADEADETVIRAEVAFSPDAAPVSGYFSAGKYSNQSSAHP